jgi:hypothetical protein
MGLLWLLDPGLCDCRKTLVEAADNLAHSYTSAEALLENPAALADLDCLISDIDLTNFDRKDPTHERKNR